MKESTTAAMAHDHVYAGGGEEVAERGTRAVVWITAATMVLEIAAGWWFNSMALLADGWHMSSHALAIGLSALAYAAARRYARDPRFAFGTWKIEVLAGFASAILLLVVAGLMAAGSIERLLAPQPIRYKEAVIVAVLGLAVNVICALILNKAHHHHDEAGHGHEHHHDLNLKSAYLHVVADAATSVLAILALLGGWFYGWSWLDPAMGIAGGVLIAVWAKGLIIETSKVLLDREMDHPVVDEVRDALHPGPGGAVAAITDIHVWRVGRAAYSCALTVLAGDRGLTPQHIREKLAPHKEIAHITVEIHHHGGPAAA
ncbi:MAG: CDF family Co(II)/Ni(II) efflux transporter DmeF [Elusimicrobiales bacterium]